MVHALREGPIDRYSIGDRTEGLKYGEDGSLTVYIQKDSPGADRESNWLPAHDGPFSFTMRIEKTTPFFFSADETADVGVDEATPVTEDYEERDNEFTGKIEKVTVEVK